MRIKITCLLILVSNIQLIYGQLESYDISTYLYPDVKRQSIGVSPDASFSNRNYVIPTSGASSFLINLGISGNHISNTRKEQTELSYYVFGRYTRLNSNQPLLLKRYNFTASGNLDKRYFFKPKKFIELGVGFYNNSFLQITRERLSDYVRNLTFSPKFGLGRLENVTDAWHAKAILKELQRSGFLYADQISHDEINAFARVISETKNYRNPDSRLESIAEFDRLASFLLESGYVELKNYGFFSLLKDAYDFEGFAVRRQGKTLKFGSEIFLSAVNYDSGDNSDEKYNIISLLIEHENHRALKNDWQLDQVYILKGGNWKYSPYSSNFFNEFKYIEFSADIRMTKYISRRINYGFSVSILNRQFEDSDDYVFTLNVGSFLEYYFSPNLRFNAIARYDIINNRDGGIALNQDNSTYIKLGVEYYFF